MKCPNCSIDLKKGWNYCPSCGNGGQTITVDISEAISRMRKEMEEMMNNGDFDKEIEAIDLNSLFKKMKPHGFSIRISSGTGQEPKVEVKSIGENQGKPADRGHNFGFKREKIDEKKGIKLPQKTEEPAARVIRDGSRLMVELEVPGVKKEKDVEINEMESSVEVKAVAKDRGYFKILTKPEQFSLVAKKLDNGKLQLIFG